MAQKDTRPAWVIKAEAATRLVHWHLLNAPLKHVLLTEYPKSGGTWLGNLLSDYLDLPFPRHRFPGFSPSVLHGHNPYSSRFDNRCVVLHRDGRDVMVSLYYHLLFNNQFNNPAFVQEMRQRLPFHDYDDIQSNFMQFLEYIQNNRFSSYKTTWQEFVLGYADKPVLMVRYEDLLEHPVETLTPVLYHFSNKPIDHAKLQAVIDKNSFKKVSAQHQASEGQKSFMRKGIAGDWRNTFQKEHTDYFQHHNARALRFLGYDID